MPIEHYFSGRGEQVLQAMRKRYGEKKGKQVFYATANKKKQNPEHKALKGLKAAKPK